MRALVVYAFTSPDGTVTLPTKAEAIRQARAWCKQHPDDAPHAEVQRVTIPGPFNRELVCRLLSSGGYASDVAIVWCGGGAR